MTRSWERYERGQEMAYPEECICGKPNSEEDGSWLCEEAPGFCSVACQAKQLAWYEAEAEAYALQLQEEAALFEKS